MSQAAAASSLASLGARSLMRSSVIRTEVKDVTPAARQLYYNVTLALIPDQELQLWYTTPGQFVNLHVTNSSARAAGFFIASAPKATAISGEVEFLIHDVTDTTADDLIKSARGTEVQLTTLADSKGFDVPQLYPIQDVETVLLFASGFGLGAIRALIEEGFEATRRRAVKLYHFFGTPDQQPYKDLYTEWQKSGVTVIPCPGLATEPPTVPITDPSTTCAALCASKDIQDFYETYLKETGVPSNKILTVFPGYLLEENTNVRTSSNDIVEFLKMGSKYVPSCIKISA